MHELNSMPVPVFMDPRVPVAAKWSALVRDIGNSPSCMGILLVGASKKEGLAR